MENKRCKYDEIAFIGNYIMCPYLQMKVPKGIFTGQQNIICSKDNKICEGANQMETKEQKIIDKLYKEKEINEKIDLGKNLIKSIKEELKELQNGNERTKN